MDLIHTEVTISIGLLIFLVGMSLFGLFMAGVALAVAFTNLWHRDQMFKELKRYNAALRQRGKTQQIGGNFHIPPLVTMTDKQKDAAVTAVTREFLEDRD